MEALQQQKLHKNDGITHNEAQILKHTHTRVNLKRGRYCTSSSAIAEVPRCRVGQF